MTWGGYLIKFGNSEIPIDYLVSGSYKCTPVKNEQKKWKDNHGNMHVDMSDNPKAHIVVETEDWLEYYKKQEICAAINDGIVNETEQRYTVEFWDDSIDGYRTAEMQLADIKYVILQIWDSGPVYDSIKIELTEF